MVRDIWSRDPGVRTNEDVSVPQLYELKTVLSPFLCSCAATPILSWAIGRLCLGFRRATATCDEQRGSCPDYPQRERGWVAVEIEPVSLRFMPEAAYSTLQPRSCDPGWKPSLEEASCIAWHAPWCSTSIMFKTCLLCILTMCLQCVLPQGSAGRHRSAWVAIATSMIFHEFHKDEVNVHYWLPSLSANGIDDVSWPCQVWSKSDMKQNQSWPDPASSTKVPKSWRHEPFWLAKDVIDRVEGPESHFIFKCLQGGLESLVNSHPHTHWQASWCSWPISKPKSRCILGYFDYALLHQSKFPSTSCCLL